VYSSEESKMAKLKTLLLIHTTANHQAAASNSEFSLLIDRPGPDLRIDVPNNPGQRKRGKLDLYPIPMSHHDIEADPNNKKFSITMIIESDAPEAGWLPGAIFVLGHTVDNELILLGNHPQWTDWFDKGDNPAGEESHEITGEQP
jgi:hypothetical protein